MFEKTIHNGVEIHESILENLMHTSPRLEIWWDSSPLVFPNWQKQLLSQVPEERKPILKEQLGRLYDPENPAATLFRGVTTNPPLSLNAILNDPERWKGWIREYISKHPGSSVETVFWELYKVIVLLGAETFLPVFENSGYCYGHLSGQVDPRAAFDGDKMLAQALELSALAPNVMVKIPGTTEGIKVIREITARGIPTNATMCYVIPQFVAVAEAVQAGILEARKNGVDLKHWRSVVTQMSARWEDAPILKEQATQAGFELSVEHKRWGSISIFKRAHEIFHQRAYPSKMLICSLRLGPEVDGETRVWHLEETAGADAVFTLPPGYISDLFLKAGHIKFEPKIRKEAPASYLEDLRKTAYFNQGIEENGYAVSEFNTIPPLQSTFTEFCGATEKMVDFVRQQLAEVAPGVSQEN
jgi:transaldolase